MWNEMHVTLRNLSKNAFSLRGKLNFFFVLVTYIDLPEIIQKVKMNLLSF